MKPSVALAQHRVAVREAAGRFRSANPRVFGSALHGADEEGSDLDILVDALPGATLFDLGALQVELEDLLGVPVDLLTPGESAAKAAGSHSRRCSSDMSLSRLGDYLDQMLTAASDARRFVDGMSKEDFLADKRTQQAVIMSLVIIGEAAARIMDKHSEFISAIPRSPGAA